MAIASRDRQVRCRDERRGHRRGGLADRNDVKSARGASVGDIAIGQRACQHTTGADRVYAGAGDLIEILSESGNGNRQ